MQRAWVVSSDYGTMVNAIIAARKQQDVPQRELARRLGKPPSFINKIEQRERRLDVLEFIAIAEALGFTASELLATVRQALPDSIELK